MRVPSPIPILRKLHSSLADGGTDAGWHSDPRALLIKEFIRRYRRSLAKPVDRTKKRMSDRLNRRRFARRKASELAKQIKKGRRLKLDKFVLTARFSRSKILDTLFPERSTRWVIAPKRTLSPMRQISLQSFDIINHPKETLESLYHIAEIECVAPYAQINFEDAYCTDIAPYLVLAEMWPHFAPIFRGGRMSPAVQKVVAAVNLDKPLEMLLGVKDTRDVWAFPIKQRRVAKGRNIAPTLAPQRKEEVADQFCNALDEWLDQDGLNLELTDAGRAKFATVIIELLDNAERHSSPDEGDALTGNWTCAAFMAKRVENGRTIYRCHLGFLSVGATIAESLALGPELTLQDLKLYTNKHKSKSLTEEALTTVFALQDGITRIHDAAGKRGGIGFQEVMKFVSILSGPEGLDGTDPRLTVISGNTCIQLKKPYVEGVSSGPSKPRLIWFNAENDHNRPPDTDRVFTLDRRFGGTVVGISFVLDHDYLKATVNDTDQSSRTDEQRPGEKSGRS